MVEKQFYPTRCWRLPSSPIAITVSIWGPDAGGFLRWMGSCVNAESGLGCVNGTWHFPRRCGRRFSVALQVALGALLGRDTRPRVEKGNQHSLGGHKHIVLFGTSDLDEAE